MIYNFYYFSDIVKDETIKLLHVIIWTLYTVKTEIITSSFTLSIICYTKTHRSWSLYYSMSRIKMYS